jgi:hypothetical protein
VGVQPPESTSHSAPPSTATVDTSRAKPDMLELKIEAGKPTRLRVVADGKPVFVGKFVATQSQVFQARDRFEVTSSETTALVLELNSQIQPPLGPPGQPGSVVLTRKDLKPAPGGKD